MRRYPDRLVGGIVMHPRLWNDDVAATVRKMVLEQGFRMLYLNPSLHKFWLPIKTPSEGAGARKLLYPIFEAARELDIPVMIHSGEQPYALPATIDFVAGAFPDVNIIIAHLGTQGELYTIEALLVADRHPNVYLETSWAMPHMIIEAIHEVGADRLIFGSNTPPLEMTQQIMNVEEAMMDAPPIGMGASEADTRAVLGGNLARLLGILAQGCRSTDMEYRIIDSHAHIIPQREPVWGWGPNFTVDRLLEMMDRPYEVLGETKRVEKAVVMTGLGLTSVEHRSMEEAHKYALASVKANKDRLYLNPVINPRAYVPGRVVPDPRLERRVQRPHAQAPPEHAQLLPTHLQPVPGRGQQEDDLPGLRAGRGAGHVPSCCTRARRLTPCRARSRPSRRRSRTSTSSSRIPAPTTSRRMANDAILLARTHDNIFLGHVLGAAARAGADVLRASAPPRSCGSPTARPSRCRRTCAC